MYATNFTACQRCSPENEIARNKLRVEQTSAYLARLWEVLRNPKLNRHSDTAQDLKDCIIHVSRTLQHEIAVVTALETLALDYAMPGRVGYEIDPRDWPDDEEGLWIDKD